MLQRRQKGPCSSLGLVFPLVRLLNKFINSLSLLPIACQTCYYLVSSLEVIKDLTHPLFDPTLDSSLPFGPTCILCSFWLVLIASLLSCLDFCVHSILTFWIFTSKVSFLTLFPPFRCRGFNISHFFSYYILSDLIHSVVSTTLLRW